MLRSIAKSKVRHHQDSSCADNDQHHCVSFFLFDLEGSPCSTKSIIRRGVCKLDMDRRVDRDEVLIFLRSKQTKSAEFCLSITHWQRNQGTWSLRGWGGIPRLRDMQKAGIMHWIIRLHLSRSLRLPGIYWFFCWESGWNHRTIPLLRIVLSPSTLKRVTSYWYPFW